jgi:thiamine biosynthesis lipoprotein
VSESAVHTEVVMDTTVSIRLVDGDRDDALARAFGWFHAIEQSCSRFDLDSEVQALARSPGVPFQASDILFEATRFALALAEETDGAFDPTIGLRMEKRGFNREYRRGNAVDTTVATEDATYRDVHMNEVTRTIRLDKPVLLDLGAVAKGFAVDMAAQELRPLENFAIDAGGDLYLGGHNERGERWTVGIRHPRMDAQMIESLLVSNAAVCTSGDYLRRTADHGAHILDPTKNVAAAGLASVTVVAPLAMVADGLATAAFVLGAERGVALLERHGVQGLLVTTDLERIRTREP